MIFSLNLAIRHHTVCRVPHVRHHTDLHNVDMRHYTFLRVTHMRYYTFSYIRYHTFSEVMHTRYYTFSAGLITLHRQCIHGAVYHLEYLLRRFITTFQGPIGQLGSF